MRDIYSRASRVIIWLGDPDYETEMVLNFLQRLAEAGRDIYKLSPQDWHAKCCRPCRNWMLKPIRERKSLVLKQLSLEAPHQEHCFFPLLFHYSLRSVECTWRSCLPQFQPPNRRIPCRDRPGKL
jgi:hypothetical protein